MSNLYSSIFLPKKNSRPRFFWLKKFSYHFFWPQQIPDPNFVGQNKIPTQILLGPKKSQTMSFIVFNFLPILNGLIVFNITPFADTYTSQAYPSLLLQTPHENPRKTMQNLTPCADNTLTSEKLYEDPVFTQRFNLLHMK